LIQKTGKGDENNFTMNSIHLFLRLSVKSQITTDG
jgi:hypothetical protein